MSKNGQVGFYSLSLPQYARRSFIVRRRVTAVPIALPYTVVADPTWQVYVFQPPGRGQLTWGTPGPHTLRFNEWFGLGRLPEATAHQRAQWIADYFNARVQLHNDLGGSDLTFFPPTKSAYQFAL